MGRNRCSGSSLWWAVCGVAAGVMLLGVACSGGTTQPGDLDVGAGEDLRPIDGLAGGDTVSDVTGGTDAPAADCGACDVRADLKQDGSLDSAWDVVMADAVPDSWVDLSSPDGLAGDELSDGVGDAIGEISGPADGWADLPDDNVLEDLSQPDSLPQVVWDNSIYTPAGEPFPIVGFGAATKGGWQEGYDVYHVTSLADSGPGTLREGLYTNNAPRVVLFDVDGTIPLVAPLLVPSNITIDGRGRNVVLQGKGFVVPGSDEVIFINLALEDIGPDSEDAFQIGSAAPDSSENIVLDHIRLTQHGDLGNAKKVDEGISIIFGTRNVTIAWCRFEKWEKVLLAGNGDAEASLDGKITLTWHHSYAWQTGRRHPQARYGKYHLFNNFWDDWYMYGSPIFSPYPESFGCQIQDHGRMLLEGMLFRRHDHGMYDGALFSTANEATRCESSGDLLEYGTWVLPDSTASLKFGVGCAKQQAFVPPYEVEPETAGPGLRDKLLVMTGNTL